MISHGEADPAPQHTPAACPDSAKVAPEPSANADRDSRGRFCKGNKGGPGNPHARRVAGLRQLLLERVSDDDLCAIVDRLVEKAKEGDLGAAKVVLSYTVGKPTPAVDPDRLDVDEFTLLKEEAVLGDEVAAPLRGIPASLACEAVKAALPVLTASRAQQLGDALLAVDEDEEDEEEEDEPSTVASTHDQPHQHDNTPPSTANEQLAQPQSPTTRQQTKEPTEPQEANAEPELPTVEQILSFARQILASSHTAPASSTSPAAALDPTAARTDSKRAATDQHAVNPGP